MFGRERWGLTNEEVALADVILTYPVNPKFASLNIAQAVLLIAYEWMAAGLDGALPTRTALPELDLTPASKEHLLGLMQHLEAALEPTGYFRTPDMRPTMVQNLRAILQRAGFTRTRSTRCMGLSAPSSGCRGNRETRIPMADGGADPRLRFRHRRALRPRARARKAAACTLRLRRRRRGVPLGEWEEAALSAHIVALVGGLIEEHRRRR